MIVEIAVVEKGTQMYEVLSESINQFFQKVNITSISNMDELMRKLSEYDLVYIDSTMNMTHIQEKTLLRKKKSDVVWVMHEGMEYPVGKEHCVQVQDLANEGIAHIHHWIEQVKKNNENERMRKQAGNIFAGIIVLYCVIFSSLESQSTIIEHLYLPGLLAFNLYFSLRLRKDELTTTKKIGYLCFSILVYLIFHLTGLISLFS